MSVWSRLSAVCWSSFRRLSQRPRRHTFKTSGELYCGFPALDPRRNNLLTNIEDLIENGMFNYNFLESLFINDTKSNPYLGNLVFQKLTSKLSRVAPTQLLPFARMAPLTSQGIEVITNLMHEFAQIGHYDSCIDLLQWMASHCPHSISHHHYGLIFNSFEHGLQSIAPLSSASDADAPTLKIVSEIESNILFLWKELMDDNFASLFDLDKIDIIACIFSSLYHCHEFQQLRDNKKVRTILADLRRSYSKILTAPQHEELLATILPYFGKFAYDLRDFKHAAELMKQFETNCKKEHKTQYAKALLAMLECDLHVYYKSKTRQGQLQSVTNVVSNVKNCIFHYLMACKAYQRLGRKDVDAVCNEMLSIAVNMNDSDDTTQTTTHYYAQGEQTKHPCEYALDYLKNHAKAATVTKKHMHATTRGDELILSQTEPVADAKMLQYVVRRAKQLDGTFDLQSVKQALSQHKLNTAAWLDIVEMAADALNSHTQGTQKEIEWLVMQHSRLIRDMTFGDILPSLEGLDILASVSSDKALLVSEMRKVQSRLIDLFLSYELVYSKNHSFVVRWGGRRVDPEAELVPHQQAMLDLTYLLSMLSKHKLYNWKLLRLLGQQCILILFSLRPSEALAGTEGDFSTPCLPFAQLTDLLVQLRELQFYQLKLYSMIANKLEQRGDLITLDQLREWCLTFATSQHQNNSIWLTIDSCLWHMGRGHEFAQAPLECVIDLVWSYVVVDLIPSWDWPLLDRLYSGCNALISGQCLGPDGLIDDALIDAKLDRTRQIRLYEIIVAMRASDASDGARTFWFDTSHLRELYDETVVKPFNEQCERRYMLNHVVKPYVMNKYGSKFEFDIDVTVGADEDEGGVLTDVVISAKDGRMGSGAGNIPMIAIECGDFAFVTVGDDGQSREWIKSPARKEVTKRILRKEDEKWFVIDLGHVNSLDENANAWLLENMERFEKYRVKLDYNTRNARNSIFYAIDRGMYRYFAMYGNTGKKVKQHKTDVAHVEKKERNAVTSKNAVFGRREERNKTNDQYLDHRIYNTQTA